VLLEWKVVEIDIRVSCNGSSTLVLNDWLSVWCSVKMWHWRNMLVHCHYWKCVCWWRRILSTKLVSCVVCFYCNATDILCCWSGSIEQCIMLVIRGFLITWTRDMRLSQLDWGLHSWGLCGTSITVTDDLPQRTPQITCSDCFPPFRKENVYSVPCCFSVFWSTLISFSSINKIKVWSALKAETFERSISNTRNSQKTLGSLVLRKLILFGQLY